MKRAMYKRLKSRCFFPDLKHAAGCNRKNKKISVQIERQQLKRETEREINIEMTGDKI